MVKISSNSKELGKNNETLDYDPKLLRVKLSFGAELRELGDPWVYGEEHLDLAKSFNYIGTCLLSLERYWEALEYNQQAFNFWIKTYENENEDLANSCNNIGMCLENFGRYDNALKYYRKALDIFIKIYGKENCVVAMGYHNVGVILERLEKYDDAFIYYHNAVLAYEASYPSDHPVLVKAREAISKVLNKKGKSQPEVKNQSRLKEILDKYGLECKEQDDIKSKEQAFRRAAWAGNIEDMQYLIENEKVDINSQDEKKGMTALHWAVKRKKKIAILWLLQLGANANIADTQGKKPKDYDQDSLMN